MSTRVPWGSFPAATSPSACPRPCTATGRMTATTELTRRTAVSSKPLAKRDALRVSNPQTWLHQDPGPGVHQSRAGSCHGSNDSTRNPGSASVSSCFPSSFVCTPSRHSGCVCPPGRSSSRDSPRLGCRKTLVATRLEQLFLGRGRKAEEQRGSALPVRTRGFGRFKDTK